MLKEIPPVPGTSESVYLTNSGESIAVQLPYWFNTDPETSLLGKVLNIFSDPMNNAIDISILGMELFPTKEDLWAPRQAYICTLPDITDIKNLNILDGWFNYSDGTPIKLTQVSSLSELLVATLPVYFIVPEDGITILLRNLEYEVIASTGTSTGSMFLHTPGKSVEDSIIYERLSLEKDINLWNRIDPHTDIRYESSILLPDEETYLYYPLHSRREGIEITWVTNSASGITEPIPVDLYNIWDKISRKFGLSRLQHESNISLRLRCLSMHRFKSDGKHKSLLGFCRDLGLLSIYEWDGTNSLELPSGTIEVLIAQTPANIWKEEYLRTSPSGMWTSSVKNWTQALVYSDGLPVEFSKIKEGLISIDEQVSSPQVKLSFEQWMLSGSTLIPLDISKGDYLVVAIQDVLMRTTKNIDTLFNESTLSNFTKQILNLSLKVSNYNYGKAAWGLTYFSEESESTAKNTLIPLRFSD